METGAFPPINSRMHPQKYNTREESQQPSRSQFIKGGHQSTYAQILKDKMTNEQHMIQQDTKKDEPSSSNQLSDFLVLTNELNDLNRIFNINKMLRLVREFKSQLLKCKNQAQQFELLLQFTQNLNNE